MGDTTPGKSEFMIAIHGKSLLPAFAGITNALVYELCDREGDEWSERKL